MIVLLQARVGGKYNIRIHQIVTDTASITTVSKNHFTTDVLIVLFSYYGDILLGVPSV